MTANAAPESTERAFASTDRAIDIDNSLQLLAHCRRRFCLYYLLQADESVAIGELAELIEESIAPPEAQVTDDVIEEGLVALVHYHLPKLRDAGLVDVDNGTVRMASNPELPIRDWLTTTATVELPPSQRAAIRPH